MKFHRWLGMRFGKECSSRCSRPSRRSAVRRLAAGRRAPSVEPLEDRRLLSVSLGQEELQNVSSPLLQAAMEISWQGETVYAEPGDWLARFDGIAGTPQEQILAVQQLLDTVQPDVIVADHLGLDGLVLLEAPVDRAYQSLLSPLQTLAGFLYVEPNLISACAAPVYPNDPLFSSLWGLDNTGQTVGGAPGAADADVDAPEAWARVTGLASVVVGIVDTGLDYNHPDLNDNVWVNPGEIAGNGIDDDANGYVDDIRGWDFVNNDNDPMDDHGHGTHVAGTIAAEGNNGLGVAGVNWDATIMPLKFLDAGGHGSTANAVKAVNYATWMRNHGVNIPVTNNSWGGGPYEQSLKDAIQANAAAGMLFVVAAGNSGRNNDVTPNYPSGYDVDNVISVAASDPSDNLARSGYFGSTFYSNYGATTVDLAAPGVSIRSTASSSGQLSDPSGYRYLNGTSMATPHVTGAAALAWSVDPTATYQEIRDLILSTVDPKPALAGAVATGGRLNVERMLTAMGMHVVGSNPGANQVVTAPPTDFSIDFSAAYDPTTVQATDLTVNDLPADTYTLTDSDTVTFHFAVSPIVMYGLQTMALADGAVSGLDGDEVAGWTTTFRYDHPAEIRGTKFEDRNGDGVRNPGETAMAGVTIYLDADNDGVLDVGELSQVTDANGDYVFAQLPAGDYVVREIVPNGYRQTFPAITPGRLFSVNTTNSQIVELDPQTGGVLRQFAAPSSATAMQGLAFDGKVLYYLSDSNDVLYQLDPDTGSLVRQTALTAGSYEGLAVLGGNIYALETSSDRLQVIDAATGGLIRTLDLRAANPGINVVGGLGEIAGPDSLLVTLSTNEIAFVDPQTGRITSTLNHGQTTTDTALTSLGQQIFVGFIDNKIRVYNRNGVLQRTLSESFTPYSLGGYLRDGSHRIALGATEVRTGVDFGNQSALGEIRGVKFEDVDGDGLRDAGEPAMAGVVVYLDADDDGRLDPEEATQTTAADGSYAFAGLMPGNHVVREVVPATYRQTFPAVTPGRLFSVRYASNQIVELDPQTGGVLRQFAVPYSTWDAQGLAFDGTMLYYLSDYDDVLYQLDPDTGAIVRQTALTAGLYDGLAVLGGKVYAMETSYDRLQVIDAATGGLVRTLDLKAANPGFSFYGGLGEIAGPDSLLVTLSTNEIAFVDPQTGRITSTLNHGQTSTDYALTSLGQEILVGFSDGKIRVYNRNGVLQRTLSESFTPYSLGGYLRDGSHRIALGPTDIRTGVDFGNQSALGEIRGTLFVDADADGLRDPDEPAHAGVTVFVDLNNNRQLDAGEPSQATDANGAYAFAGLMPGPYAVREVISADYQQSFPAVDGSVFWGAAYFSQTGTRQLVKIDAATGQVTRIGNPLNVPMSGLVVTIDGKIYGINPSDNAFYSIDPVTGQATRIGASGFLLGGMTYDRANDVIYGIGRQVATDTIVRLLIFDRTTGKATAIGPGIEGVTGTTGLAFDPEQGRILGFDNSDDEVYAFDTSGNGTRLPAFAANVYALAFAGRSLVMPNSLPGLGFINPDLGVSTGSMPISEAMTLEALEFVPAESNVRRVRLSPAQILSGIDFGNADVRGEIQGTVFIDADANGTRDPGEQLQTNVTVYLDLNDNGQLDSDEPTQVTDAEGGYRFAGVRPGGYSVRELVPVDFQQTSPGIDGGFFYASIYTSAGGNRWQLAKIDAQSGQVERIGSPQTVPLRGLVETKDGRLYGLQGSANEFYSLDPATGVMTRIGHLGFSVAPGLAYDRGTDTIYGLGRLSSSDPYYRLLVIDRTSGLATQVGNGLWTSGLTNPSGITFDPVLGKVLAFDNADKEIYAFDVGTGTPERLSVAQGAYNSWNAAHNGQMLVLHNAWGNRLYYVDPATGATTGSLLMSESLALDSLEMVPAVPYGHRVFVGKHETVMAAAFGNQSILGDLRGAAFVDADADGVRDPDEPGQAGVTVYLDQNNNGQLDPGELTAVTDQDGAYVFTDLQPATYAVRQVVPEGYRQISDVPAVDTYYGATNGGQTLVQIDAATGRISSLGPTLSTAMHGVVMTYDGRIYGINGPNSSLYSINPTTGQATLLGPSGYLLTWGLAYDRATDTIYGVGKSAVGDPNRLLVIDRATGAATAFGPGTLGLNATSAVAFDGEHGRILAFDNQDKEIYAFDRDGNVSRLSVATPPIGAYSMAWNGTNAVLGTGNRLVFINPDTGATVGELVLSTSVSLDALDFASADFSSRVVTLPAAGSLNLVGFGNQSILGDLRGAAFVDADADGVRDPDESGQAGVTVYLDQNNNGQLDPGELTAVTDQDGVYLFADIRPATYVVRQVVPEGYRQISDGPAVDTYYGATNAGQTRLVQIDAATGNVSSLGPTLSTAMHGIVMTYDGRIYGINGPNSSLYSINPTTGQATLLGPSGYLLTWGLAYDRATDTIYGVGKSAVGSPNRLLVFDPTTGAATALGPGTLGLNATSAVAFDGEHGRILAFDNQDKEIYAFDRSGNVSRLSVATPPIGVYSMAWNGTSAVLGTGNRLVYIHPDTGTTIGELVLSTSVSLDALDFASADFSSRVVTLPAAGSLNLVGFGNYSAPPTADAGGPYTAPEGSAIYLDATSSYDPEEMPLEYLWDLDGDGLFGETGVAAQRGDEVGANPLFSAESLDDGIVTVALRVTDNVGKVAEATASVTIVNVAPRILSAEIVPDALEEGTKATFFLRFADPGACDLHEITIDWGDGSRFFTRLGAGLIWQPFSHTYADDKPSGTASDTYTVHVTVADDEGAVAEQWAIVERTQFHFENSYTFNDDLTHHVAEFAEDGYTIRTASGNGFEIDGVWSPRGDGITSARVATPGETVTLSRDDGQPFTFYSLSVRNPDKSGNVAKRVTFTGVRADGSQVVQTLDTLYNNDSYPFRGFTDVVSVSWQASEEAGYSPSYRFNDVVVATQAPQVSDPTITVSNVAPRITGLSVDQPVVDEGATVTLTGSFVDPGLQDTHRVIVDWGDGQTTSMSLAQGSRSFALTHSYLDDVPSGTSVDGNAIRVTVEDDDGGIDNSGVVPTLSSVAWDFDEWAFSTRDSLLLSRPTKAGYTISPSFSVVGPFDPSFVGSTALVSPQNQNIVLSKNDGGLFTLRSIDVAELPAPQYMPAYITYTGTRADGSTIVKSVQTDGQIGFEQIVFDGFTDLVSLTWRGQDPVTWHYGGFHQFDNLVLEGWSNPVPSPVVTVNNVAPVLGDLALSAATIDENGLVTLTGSFTDVGTLDTHSVLIQWGDGTSSMAELVQGAGSGTFTATHRYLDDDPNGTASDRYHITASVTDDDGGQSTAETSVTVTNVAPSTSILGVPLESPEGTTIAIASQVVDPGTVDTFTYAWSVTKDGQAYASGNEASFTFTPDDSGSYLVSLTVTDDDGGASNAVEEQIVVTNVGPTATFTNHQSITYGETVTIGFSDAFDPSGVDTAAGFRYAYATSPSGFDGVTYANSSETAEHDFSRLSAGDQILYGRIIDKDDGFTQYSMEVHVERKAASVTPNPASKTYGDADPTLTGTLDGFLEADAVLASYQRTAGETVLGGPYTIAATLSPADVLSNYSITYNTAEFTINPALLTITANDAAKNFGHTLMFVGSEFTSSGLVNGDSVTSVALTSLGSLAASPVGSYDIEASAAVGTGLSNYAIAYNMGTLTVALSPSGMVVLDPTVSGALTMSGNASIHTAGDVIVASASTSAISLSGNAQLAADNILLAGGIKTSGNATYSGNEIAAPGLGDPLANLAAPSFVGSGAAVSVISNSEQILNPGVYSSIKVAGNGSLILNPGVYIITGGGLSVTGNGSISGEGVFIYNTGGGSTYGGIALSGNGTCNLTAPADGPFAGVLIFQDRLNTRAMSLSGNAAASISGTIYAKNALLAMSGNAQAALSLVVDRIQISGNGAAALSIDGLEPEAGTNAGELLAKDLYLYVDNPSGSFSADALARLDEAIANLHVLLSAYNVSVDETADRSVANVVLTTDDSSAAGGYLDGVLGCFSETGEITLLQGWDWYTGVDPAAIGPGQYDFQTIVTHELGHALGLGHSNDARSVMYAMLDASDVRRAMSVADLNVCESHEAAEALRALPFEAIKALAAATPLHSNLSMEARNIFSLSNESAAAVRVTVETAEQADSGRGILDSLAVEAVLQSAYRGDEEPTAYLSPKRIGDGEWWMASSDRETDTLSDETAVDLAMQDVEKLLAGVGEGE